MGYTYIRIEIKVSHFVHAFLIFLLGEGLSSLVKGGALFAWVFLVATAIAIAVNDREPSVVVVLVILTTTANTTCTTPRRIRLSG
jgi:hypothetical protein